MGNFLGLSAIRGIGLIVLQALRAATVTTLLTAAVSCWILIINVDKNKDYFVFECFTLFFTSTFSFMLIISELAFWEPIRVYLRRTWPVLSDHHGIGWLGLGMIIIGCNILGTLNHDLHMSSAFSSLTLASGILCVIFGVLNIISSFAWCDRKEGITSRDIRAHGSLAKAHHGYPEYDDAPSRTSSLRNEKTKSKFMSMFWKKEKDEQSIGRRDISGPYVHHPDRDVEAQNDDQTSPIIPGLKRPDTALHPMHSRHSHYSEANMSRF